MSDIRPRAAVLATIGALAVAASSYFDWLGNRSPRDTQLERLLLQSDSTDAASSYWMSMAAPLAVIGALGVLGTLALSRLVLWLTFLLALATVALWATGAVFDAAPGGLVLADVQPGAWVNLGGVILLLIGAAALRQRTDEDDEEDEFSTPPLSRALADDAP